LRDGTRLVLGPAGRLRISGDFGVSTRAVTLDGEALFAVTHDARHPFTVQTGHVLIRDVGTVFGVRAYATDRVEQIVVQEGAVAVGANRLRARDVATLAPNGSVTVRAVPDVTPYLAWSQGRLVFSATPLRDVARELGRNFGLEIDVPDSVLASKSITASFTDEPVDLILDEVTSVVGAQFHRNGRTVVIQRRTTHGPGTSTPPPGLRATASATPILTAHTRE
jgi:ferric-dicitrate binding protein FerR (iron transport regulator)